MSFDAWIIAYCFLKCNSFLLKKLKNYKNLRNITFKIMQVIAKMTDNY